MFKKYLVFFFFLFVTAQVSAQTDCNLHISGVVVQANTKEKVPGAVVYIKGTKIFAQTNAQGQYHLSPLCPGSYTLICEISGFDKKEILVQVSQNFSQNFELKEKTSQLEEVVVQGHHSEHTAQMNAMLSEEEKNRIREQHTGGKKIMIENFNKLVNTKLGDAKPLSENE